MDNTCKIEVKDHGKQFTINMSTTTYHIIMNNIVPIGERVGLKMVKALDVDSSGKALKSQYECQLFVTEALTASITISCYHTTNNILVQLKGKKIFEDEWAKKLEAVHYFAHVTMKSLIMGVEQTENYMAIKEKIRESLREMQESGIRGETSRNCEDELMPTIEISKLIPATKSDQTTSPGRSTTGSDESLLQLGEIGGPTPSRTDEGCLIKSTENTTIVTPEPPQCPPPALPSNDTAISALNCDGDEAAIIVQKENEDILLKEPKNIDIHMSPVSVKPSPSKSPSKKCNKGCSQRITSLENEKRVISQKVQTLETHQLTLRNTIVSKDETLNSQIKTIEDLSQKNIAQKKLITEQELMIHVHENVAVTYMDMIVNGEESLEVDESDDNKLHTQLKNMYNVVKNLRQEMNQLKEEAELEKTKSSDLMKKHQSILLELEKCQQSLTDSQNKLKAKTKEASGLVKQVADSEQTRSAQNEKIRTLTDELCLKEDMISDAQVDNQQLVERCQSLESTNNDLLRHAEDIRTKSSSDNLNKQLQTMLHDKENEITLLQEGHAYIEKSLQEKEQENREVEGKLKVTEEMWKKDKDGLQSCQEKYTNLQEEQKKLQMQLRATQMQLGKSKELLDLNKHEEESSQHNLKDKDAHAEHVLGDSAEEPQAQNGGQEVCIFELLKPGSCNRGKKKCRFSHEIHEHLLMDSVVSEKAKQISQKLNKCVYHMVERGSCPLQESCPYYNKHDTAGKTRAAKTASLNPNTNNICYSELLEEGSCEKGPRNCRFHHNIPESMKADYTLINQIKQGMLIRKICINEYREAHSCKKKDAPFVTKYKNLRDPTPSFKKL